MIPDFYFDTRFKDIATATEFPVRFGIITAYATTGETWTAEQNNAADIRLLKELESRGVWHTRITGYVGEHGEPGWAADLSLVDTIKLGKEFEQHGIYYVDNNTLSVHLSDGTRGSAHVADFSDRTVRTLLNFSLAHVPLKCYFTYSLALILLILPHHACPHEHLSQ